MAVLAVIAILTGSFVGAAVLTPSQD